MKRSSFHCCVLLLSLWTTNSYADDPRLVIDAGRHTSIIREVIFTRDGKYLVSAGDDKVIRIWEVAPGKIARTIRGQIGDGIEGCIYAAALSPDNKI